MKKDMSGSLCLVIGFILFCLLHMVALKSASPFFDYAFFIGPILVVLGLLLGVIRLRKQNVLPIIASGFSFAPLLLLLFSPVPYAGMAFAMLFFVSAWGLGFCFVGFILGIISLFKCVKNKKEGITYSIIAILAPLLWALYLVLYARNGGELFI